MKKVIINIVDVMIFVLCFLFLLSSFFKLISYSDIEHYIYKDANILITIWGMGIIFAFFFTRPLFQWILHFRHLK